MKARDFDYRRPRSLDEAFDLLGQPGARIIAGGQSLVPALNLRTTAPSTLVDIGGLDELRPSPKSLHRHSSLTKGNQANT